MTRVSLRRTYLRTAALAVILVLTACSFLSAQKRTEVCASNKEKNLNVSQIVLDNYANGLKSDNKGLKENCIYYAGFYGFEGLVEPLINLLAKETDPHTRILIALALYSIGNEVGIKAIEEITMNDSNKELRKFGNANLDD